MEILRRLCRYALVALPALLGGLSAQAQDKLIDPVSGLPIPLLPGQVLIRTTDGCGIIAERGRVQTYWSDYRWVGTCRYGVVDGPGALVLDKPPEGKPPTYSSYKPKLGIFDETNLDYTLFVPRSDSRPNWEYFAIYKRTLPSDNEDMLDKRAPFPGAFFLEYQTGDATSRTSEYVSVDAQQCASYWTKPKQYIDYYKSYPRDQLTQKEIERIATYCSAASKRLAKEGYQTFDDVSYGRYYLVMTRKEKAQATSNPREFGPAQETRKATLCPDLTTPWGGCEPIWRSMITPYIARFDQLRPTEAAIKAEQHAQNKRRFAPLAAAWRRKFAELKALQ